MAKTPLEKAPEPKLGSAPIPKERYTSREFMEREWDGMWTRVWLIAGRESDLARAGDWLTFEIGPESILVARQKDGGLRAFHNVCQHRGNRLCEPGRGRGTSLACRFHGWVYGCDGSLERVTDRESFPQGIDEKRLALPEVRCDVWGGFVWVNLDPAAESLRDYLGVLPEHLDPYHFEEQRIITDVTLEVDCNWKTSVDAFNEAYHVQATHPGLLQYSDDVNVQIDCYERHSRFLYPLALVSPRLPNRGEITEPIRQLFLQGAGLDPEGFDGSADDVRPAIAKAMRERKAQELGVDYSELDDRQLVDDFHYTIFPNVTLNIHALTTWVFRHRPHPSDPNKMLFDFVNLLRAPKAEVERPPHERHAASEYSLANATPGGEVLDEDMWNLPRIQAGMSSRGYRELFLGDQEVRIRHFHATLDEYLEGGSRQRTDRDG